MEGGEGCSKRGRMGKRTGGQEACNIDRKQGGKNWRWERLIDVI